MDADADYDADVGNFTHEEYGDLSAALLGAAHQIAHDLFVANFIRPEGADDDITTDELCGEEQITDDDRVEEDAYVDAMLSTIVCTELWGEEQVIGGEEEEEEEEEEPTVGDEQVIDVGQVRRLPGITLRPGRRQPLPGQAAYPPQQFPPPPPPGGIYQQPRRPGIVQRFRRRLRRTDVPQGYRQGGIYGRQPGQPYPSIQPGVLQTASTRFAGAAAPAYQTATGRPLSPYQRQQMQQLALRQMQQTGRFATAGYVGRPRIQPPPPPYPGAPPSYQSSTAGRMPSGIVAGGPSQSYAGQQPPPPLLPTTYGMPPEQIRQILLGLVTATAQSGLAYLSSL